MNQGNEAKKFYHTPTGAATILVVLVFSLFRLSSVDLQSDTQRRGIDWFIASESGFSSFLDETPSLQPARTPRDKLNSQKRKKTPIFSDRPPTDRDRDRVIASQVNSSSLVRDTSIAPTLVPSVDEVSRWKYGVCLLVTIGDEGNKKQRKGLPYTELYRLFNAVRAAAGKSEQRKALTEREIFVRTDSPSIVCKMVRDSLGQSAICSTSPKLEGMSKQCKHLVVGRTKTYTPQPSVDAKGNSTTFWDTEEIVDLDAVDPAREAPRLPESEWKPTVVTAFSTNHLDVGLLLLRSLGKAASGQSTYNISVVVWTMDEFPQLARKALDCVVEELKTLYKVPVEVRRFDFSAWPSWMRINQKRGYRGGRGEYAWKAVMIQTVLVDRGLVYWADAGARFKTPASLTSVLDHVKLKGFASRASSGTVKMWSHARQLQFFRATKASITSMRNCDASGIGFSLKRYTELARPWYECSTTRQCIAPDGSSRKNHRQDQSALTVLAALSGDKCEGVSSGIAKNMDSNPKGYLIGVDRTKCYKDPLAFKWQ